MQTAKPPNLNPHLSFQLYGILTYNCMFWGLVLTCNNTYNIIIHLYRHSCRETFYEGSVGHAPFFLNVDYGTGKVLNHWLDSLSASFAAVQVSTFSVIVTMCTRVRVLIPLPKNKGVYIIGIGIKQSMHATNCLPAFLRRCQPNCKLLQCLP